MKRIALVRTRVLSDGDAGPCEERATEEEYGPPRTVIKDVEVAVFSLIDFQKFIQDKNVLSERYDEIVCSPVGVGALFYVLKLHMNYGGRNVKRVWQYRGKLRGCLKFVSNVLSTAACLPFVPFDLISFLPLPITTVITQMADVMLNFVSELVVFVVTLLEGIKAQFFHYFLFCQRRSHWCPPLEIRLLSVNAPNTNAILPVLPLFHILTGFFPIRKVCTVVLPNENATFFCQGSFLVAVLPYNAHPPPLLSLKFLWL